MSEFRPAAKSAYRPVFLRIPFRLLHKPVFLAILTVAATPPAFSADTFTLDLESYRTPVSPGSVEEDLLFLKDFIPVFTRAAIPRDPNPKTLEYEAVELEVERSPVAGVGKTRKSFKTDHKTGLKLQITGSDYKNAAEAFLMWRREFEAQWIASATQGAAAPKTPLQEIVENRRLSRKDKIDQVLSFYARQQMTYQPPPTPHPDFWPVSEVIQLSSIHASVQFNPRGGKVVVLEQDTGKAYVLPFNPGDDPHAWMDRLVAMAKVHGLDQATERMRKETLKTGEIPYPKASLLPRRSPTPRSPRDTLQTNPR